VVKLGRLCHTEAVETSPYNSHQNHSQFQQKATNINGFRALEKRVKKSKTLKILALQIIDYQTLNKGLDNSHTKLYTYNMKKDRKNKTTKPNKEAIMKGTKEKSKVKIRKGIETLRTVKWEGSVIAYILPGSQYNEQFFEAEVFYQYISTGTFSFGVDWTNLQIRILTWNENKKEFEWKTLKYMDVARESGVHPTAIGHVVLEYFWKQLKKAERGDAQTPRSK